MKYNKRDLREILKWLGLVVIEGVIQNYIMPAISGQNKTILMQALIYLIYAISFITAVWLFYSIVIFIIKKYSLKQREEIELLKGCIYMP